MIEPRTDPGSFRDRHSRVFYLDGRILRGLSATALEDWNKLSSTRFFSSFSEDGFIVGTRRCNVTADTLESMSSNFVAALEHERIPFVSYPYEWSLSMLRDAALLTLRLLEAALSEGMNLKDASSFNVQFQGTLPVFIDLGSFETRRQGEPWIGYQQFCRLFLYPLMIRAYKDIAFQPLLRASVDGITPETMARLISPRDLLRRGVLTHVILQSRFIRQQADAKRGLRRELSSLGFKKEMILHNVHSLKSLIRGLRYKSSSSQWSDYTEMHSYNDEDFRAKKDFVKRAIDSAKPELVWDLGCNTGDFSKIAARSANYVVAMDADELAIDLLYRALARDGPSNILPIVINLVDPSPGLGWRNQERSPILSRGTPDLILSLALVHHLVIGANIPMTDLLHWYSQTCDRLVIEFIIKDDPMVQQLLMNKIDNYEDYEIDFFERTLDRFFDVRERLPLSSGLRFLFSADSRT